MHRVIVVGSPRPDGRSAMLADELFNACIEECPEDGVSIVSVASLEVSACRGCDACKLATAAPEKLPESDDNLAIMPIVAESDALLHRCVIHDDMTDVRKHIDAADELIVVTPVYFASVPAQLKCLMDRLQPYYWSNVRKLGKRPLVLHVVGEGGDPHGFEPLIGTVRSAFGSVGFELELVLDWVGKINEEGEIIAEAEEYPIPPVGGFAGFSIDGDEFEIVEIDGEFPEGFDFDDAFEFEGDFDYEDALYGDGALGFEGAECDDTFYGDEGDDDRGDYGDRDGVTFASNFDSEKDASKPDVKSRGSKSGQQRAKLSITQDGKKPSSGDGGSAKKGGKPSGKGSGKGKASYGKNKQPKSAKGGKRRG